MLSEFEERTLDLGVGLYESAYGAELRRFDPHRESGVDNPNSIAAVSLNVGPPIHRTGWALEWALVTEHPLDLEAEQDLLEWWIDASAVVVGIASHCWGSVPVGLRAAVYDEDDLGPLFSHYIPDTRATSHPTDGKAIDLRSASFWPELHSFAEAAQGTGAYSAVLDAIQPLGKKDRRRLQRLAREIDARVEAATRELRYDVARQRARALVAAAYDSASRPLRAFAHAVRSYNELLNHAFWAALAIAEADEGITAIDQAPTAMRLTRNGRYEDLTFALEGAGGLSLLSVPAPFLLEVAKPIDGVYLSRRRMVQWRGGSISDVAGRRLSALESA